MSFQHSQRSHCSLRGRDWTEAICGAGIILEPSYISKFAQQSWRRVWIQPSKWGFDNSLQRRCLHWSHFKIAYLLKSRANKSYNFQPKEWNNFTNFSFHSCLKRIKVEYHCILIFCINIRANTNKQQIHTKSAQAPWWFSVLSFLCPCMN